LLCAFASRRRSASDTQFIDERCARAIYISSAEIAAVYAALADKPNCLAWLQKAVQERASALIYLKVDPVFDRMRADPRFQAIVAEVGLAPEMDETKKK
jgi:hypothetical protein